MPLRLAASKPARWIGRGELLHVPWGPCTYGPVLLIELWAGFSGATLALLTLGVRCYVLAAEEDLAARAVAAANIAGIIHIDLVSEIRVEMVAEIVKRRAICGIIIGGG